MDDDGEQQQPLEPQPVAEAPVASVDSDSAKPPAELPAAAAAPAAIPAAKARAVAKRAAGVSAAVPRTVRRRSREEQQQQAPAIVADPQFFVGLLQTQRAMEKQARNTSYSNLRIA